MCRGRGPIGESHLHKGFFRRDNSQPVVQEDGAQVVSIIEKIKYLKNIFYKNICSSKTHTTQQQTTKTTPPTNQSDLKMCREYEYFSKEDKQMGNRFMKIHSTSLIIRVMRYPRTPVRMAVIKKTRHSKVLGGCGEIRKHYWWECR